MLPPEVSMSDGLGKRIQRLRGAERAAAIDEVIARWRASGTSKASFCREAGIATVTLGRWLRKLEVERAVERSPVLVEVGRRERPVRDGYEVVLPGGVEVRVPAGFSDEDLARLLRVLVTAC
jgi:hypothetical protein